MGLSTRGQQPGMQPGLIRLPASVLGLAVIVGADDAAAIQPAAALFADDGACALVAPAEVANALALLELLEGSLVSSVSEPSTSQS
jgi:hypothetical protein